MLNSYNVIGNLTKDVELRYLPNGSCMSTFSIANNSKYTSNGGEIKQEVMYIDIVCFGVIAETCNQYLHKGSKVCVSGRIVFNQWTDQMGQKKSKHEVVASSIDFLDTKPQDTNNPYTQQPKNTDNQGVANE